jgi:hypothetical protein
MSRKSLVAFQDALTGAMGNFDEPPEERDAKSKGCLLPPPTVSVERPGHLDFTGFKGNTTRVKNNITYQSTRVLPQGWTVPRSAEAHPKDSVPLFKKYIEVDTSINRNLLIKHDKACASALRRKLLRRNIKVVHNQEHIEKIKQVRIAKKANQAQNKQGQLVVRKEEQMQRAEAVNQAWLDEREDRWAQRCSRTSSLYELERRIERGLPYGLVSAVRIDAVGSLDLGAPLTVGMSTRSMHQMCWMVAIWLTRSSHASKAIVNAIEKQKPIALDNFHRMALARLIQAGISNYVHRKLRRKSLACVKLFARDFPLCLETRFGVSAKQFRKKVEDAQGYMVGFLRVQDARAVLLDKVWCMVEHSVSLNVHASSGQDEKGEAKKHGRKYSSGAAQRRQSQLEEYMHTRMYAKHSVVEVLHMLRPQSEFEGRSYAKAIKREVRKLQDKGVVGRTLKPHDHVLLAKILRPRPELVIPKAVVPKAVRRRALLRYLSKCRDVHRHSPEMESKFSQMTQSEEVHKTELQMKSMRWMLQADNDAVTKQVETSLKKHGTLFPAVAKAKIEWPCVRALTDRRFGGLFVEAIEGGIREHMQAVAKHADDVQQRRQLAAERRAQEAPAEYLRSSMDDCEKQYKKVRPPTQWDKLHERSTSANESRRNSWGGRERHYQRKLLHGEM